VDGLFIEVAHEAADVTLLKFRGEFDLASSAAAWDALNPHLVDHRHVRVDLSGVEFIDSSGLSVFVQCRHRQDCNGGSFTVTAMSPAARHLLELAGLLEFLGADGDGDGPQP
jgi:anti-sigma B factor antagonist